MHGPWQRQGSRPAAARLKQVHPPRPPCRLRNGRLAGKGETFANGY